MPITVLLVEDDPGDARIIEERLKEAGAHRFAVTRAERFASCVEKLSAHVPDVVILDLSLPDSTGLATLRQVQRTAPGVPIVVLTGLDDEELAVSAVMEGRRRLPFEGRRLGRPAGARSTVRHRAKTSGRNAADP